MKVREKASLSKVALLRHVHPHRGYRLSPLPNHMGLDEGPGDPGISAADKILH